MLSVTIITHNEAANIGPCLDSVAWADEIVVLDSGSTDDTVATARAKGARVEIAADWQGFGRQKNRALDLATGDWVLSLDADERVTPELRDEIRALLAGGPDANAYRMPRLSSYCGRYMRHSGWWPDRVTRLFRRGRGRFSEDPVHERLMHEGPAGTLAAHLVHESFPDLEAVLDKMDRYSTAGARTLHQSGRRASLTGAVARGLWAFIRTYVLRAGFLDGREGFMLAVSNAEGTYYRYAKLILLNRRTRP